MLDILFLFGVKMLVVIMGVYYYRHLPFAYRLVLLQSVLAISAEVLGLAIVKVYHQYNVWVFNIYDLLFEVWLMTIAGYYLLSGKMKNTYIFLAPALLTIVWVYGVSRKGLMDMYTPFLLGKSILLISVYMLLLYQTAFGRRDNVSRLPAFWLSLSMILFFGGALPFYGFYNFLVVNQPDILSSLFYSIIWTLNFIRYPMAAYSLYLAGSQQKRLKQKTIIA